MSRVVIGKLVAGLEVILSLVTYLPMSSSEPDGIQESVRPPVAENVVTEHGQVEIAFAADRWQLE